MTVLTRFVLVFMTDLTRCGLPYMINLKQNIYKLSTYILKFKFWLCLHGVGRERFKKLESGSWSEKG